MYAKHSVYSEYLIGARIDRVRVFLGGAGVALGAASIRLAAPTTRRRFVGFFAALRETFRLLVFALSRKFLRLQRRVAAF
jgi:hypothetical protein